jgi:hypothetical protein
VAWIVVPEEPAPVAGTTAEPGDAAMPAVGGTRVTTRSDSDGGRAGLVVGIGLVVIGVWFLVRDYLPDFNWNLVWPAILIGIGALILINSSRRRS